MKLVKYDKFLEATLDLPLLRSERNGEQRGNLLVRELEKPEPELRLNNKDNDVVKIDKENAEDLSDKITKNGEYDNEEGIKTFKTGTRSSDKYRDVIKDEKGNKYKLNQFKKDKVFGSSGAGVNTRSYERLQCIYLAHKLVRPNEDLTYENVIRLLADTDEIGNEIANLLKLHVPDTGKVDNILVSALSKPDWETTLIEVTNDLYNFTSRNVRIFKEGFTGKYHVYHISCDDADSPFTLIRNKFNFLLKMEATDNMSKLSFGDSALAIEFSKYCPADVMVRVNDIDLEKLIDVKSITELTECLNKLFSDRVLIPISLKKVGVTVDSVKTYNIIVNNEFERPLPDFEIDSFTIYDDVERGIGSKINVNSSWKDAKGNEIDGEDRSLTIDSSNTSNKVNVDGEVQGKFSRHGKISFTYMKYFINSIRDNISLDKIQALDEYSKLKDLSENELINKINNILSELYKIEVKYRTRVKIDYPKRTLKSNDMVSTGRPIGENNRKNKLISKLQSLQIILSIVQVRVSKIKDANEIINKIMRYALSIQADVFITPRYVRVI